MRLAFQLGAQIVCNFIGEFDEDLSRFEIAGFSSAIDGVFDEQHVFIGVSDYIGIFDFAIDIAELEQAIEAHHGSLLGIYNSGLCDDVPDSLLVSGRADEEQTDNAETSGDVQEAKYPAHEVGFEAGTGSFDGGDPDTCYLFAG